MEGVSSEPVSVTLIIDEIVDSVLATHRKSTWFSLTVTVSASNLDAVDSHKRYYDLR